MGAENSVLEGCDWGDKLPSPKGFQWNLSPVSKKDGMEAVVFQPKNSDKKDNNLLQKCATMLKRLRHPNFLRFLGCGTSPDGFWLATEPVSPLLATTVSVGLTSHELVGGIWDVLQALDFLHSKLGVCHNNICPDSIYVSKDGSWKLGGMEHACKFLEATPEFLESTRAFRNEDCLAPEEKTGKVKLDMITSHARDIFALGALVDALMDSVRDKNAIVAELEKQMTPCVSSDPSSRPTTSNLTSSLVFRSDFIDMVAFIKNVTVKTDAQKKKFFGSLLPKLQQIPEEVIARKLVLPLLSRFILLDETAEKKVVPSLLIPRKDGQVKSECQGLLNESLFQSYVIPHLCNVFRVHDCHIRLVLLTHFHQYAHLFSREQLEEDIFLQILLGIRDTDDRLVASSLKALADLVPLLGGDFVIGGSRKCFFFHGIPKPVSADNPQTLSSSLSASNVTSILPSAKPSLLKDPNYKPLLKDLAAGVRGGGTMSSSVSAEERERKMREREQRREEARLKREGRKLKLKSKQMSGDETSNDKGDNLDIVSSSLMIEKVAALDQEEKLEEQKENGLFTSPSPEGEEEEEPVVDEENRDWSDWEDADGENISDEIEEELRNMSEGNYSERKVQTSPSPYEKDDTLNHHPSVKVDWSNVPVNSNTNYHGEVKNSKGPLSLGGVKKANKRDATSEISDKNVENDSSNWEDADWNPDDAVDVYSGVQNSNLNLSAGANVLRLKDPSSSSSSTSSTKSNTKKLTPRFTDDLGSGYDIKSVEIKSKTKSQLDDLFADMAPVISTVTANPVKELMGSVESAGSKVDSMGLRVKMAEEETSKPQMNSSLFAVDTTAQGEEESSWGDEDDGWGTEDF